MCFCCCQVVRQCGEQFVGLIGTLFGTDGVVEHAGGPDERRGTGDQSTVRGQPRLQGGRGQAARGVRHGRPGARRVAVQGARLGQIARHGRRRVRLAVRGAQRRLHVQPPAAARSPDDRALRHQAALRGRGGAAGRAPATPAQRPQVDRQRPCLHRQLPHALEQQQQQLEQRQ